MDAFIEFLPLLFLAVYYLLASKRKKLQKQRQQQRPQPSGEPKAPSPFEQFVHQMEEAMREASGEAPEENEPIVVKRPTTPPPAPMPVPVQRPLTSLGERPAPEFHDLGSFRDELVFETSRKPAHERHGFGLDQPFSEERFEQMARGLDETRHDHAPLAPQRPTRVNRTARWRRQLADPKQAQDALVLKEIFSGPWSPRRPHRRHD